MLFTLFLIVVGLTVIFFKSYNRLQTASQAVKESASNIDIMLRKKLELTGQLMDVCRAYADHEKLVLLKVSADQTAAVGDLAAASNRADLALAYFSQLGDRFPDLKANASFQQLASQLEALGNELQLKRERYNGMASSYNQVRNLVPAVFVARLLSFSEAKHLDFGDAESMDVLRSFQTDDGAKLEHFLGNIGNQMARGTRAAVQKATQVTGSHRVGVADSNSRADDRKYFYSLNGVGEGPVPRDELRRLISTGSITASSYVLAEGSQEWLPYESAFPDEVIRRPVVPPPPDAKTQAARQQPS